MNSRLSVARPDVVDAGVHQRLTASNQRGFLLLHNVGLTLDLRLDAAQSENYEVVSLGSARRHVLEGVRWVTWI